MLRPLRASDRDGFLSALAESREHLDASFPLHEPGWTDEHVFERYLAWTISGLEAGKSVRRAMLDAEDGRFVGMMNLLRIERGLEARAEVSFWTRLKRSRQGLAREALRAMVDDAFEDLPRGLGLHTICAWVQPMNITSIRLVTSLGFVASAEAPQQIETGGRWLQHMRFSVTVDLWEQANPR